MNEEEYELYEMQQRKKDMAAKYARPKCEHDKVQMIDEYQEIGDGNDMIVTQWFKCDCGATGTRMYVIPAEIEWGEK